jgi:glutathione S-transferase
MLLIIGNKNYSSWSFRPWIAMKVAGISFEERVISLNDPDFKRAIASVSKNGRVPAIDDDGVPSRRKCTRGSPRSGASAR